MKKFIILFNFVFLCSVYISAQQKENTIKIYGTIITNSGYDFKTDNPNWYDALRPTQLPAFQNEYKPDGKTFWSVRPTSFGIKSKNKTSFGFLKTQFEFDMFGSGDNEGQTTFHLNYAYGQLGKFGAGQYNSAFMDYDVFPNILEYWGPPGMVFYRNIQLRYMPLMEGEYKLTFSLEMPGASGDGGVFSDRVELEGIKGQFYFPDFTTEFIQESKWGYVRFGGIVRSIKWVDVIEDSLSIDGSAVGWGGNVSSNINVTKNDVLKLQVVYGEGIENYMNDAPVDIGIDTSFSGKSVTRPFKGVPLPVTGIVAFLDHSWSKYFSSTAGYSLINIDNSDAQSKDAFRKGQYVIANILYYPADGITTGVEYQWEQRNNYGGFISNDTKVQFSFQYNFSKVFSWKQ